MSKGKEIQKKLKYSSRKTKKFEDSSTEKNYFRRTSPKAKSRKSCFFLSVSSVSLFLFCLFMQPWDEFSSIIPAAKIFPSEEKSRVDKADECWHLDKRPDDGGERLRGVDAEHGHGHGDGQLEVVAGGGE